MKLFSSGSWQETLLPYADFLLKIFENVNLDSLKINEKLSSMPLTIYLLFGLPTLVGVTLKITSLVSLKPKLNHQIFFIDFKFFLVEMELFFTARNSRSTTILQKFRKYKRNIQMSWWKRKHWPYE